MPFKISRLGGTSLRRSFITNVYWAVMCPRRYTRAPGFRLGHRLDQPLAEAPDRRIEAGDVDRLHHVVVESRVAGLRAIAVAAVAGERDQRQRLGGELAAQPARELVA